RARTVVEEELGLVVGAHLRTVAAAVASESGCGWWRRGERYGGGHGRVVSCRRRESLVRLPAEHAKRAEQQDRGNPAEEAGSSGARQRRGGPDGRVPEACWRTAAGTHDANRAFPSIRRAFDLERHEFADARP